jgi:hypothetical protein
VPTILRLLIAAILGLATAFLIACGSSGRGLISSSDGAGDCATTRSALDQARQDLANLPPTVDPRLQAKLAQGLANLAHNALIDCRLNRTQPTTTTPTTPPTQTTTTTPPTTTQPSTSSTPTQTAPPSSPPQTTSTSTQGGSGGAEAPGNGGNGGNGNGGSGDGNGGGNNGGANGGNGGGSGGGTPGQ